MGKRGREGDEEDMDAESKVELISTKVTNLKEDVTRECSEGWAEALAEAQRLAGVSDAENRADSHEQAVVRYSAQHAPSFFPEPTAVARLIQLSTRTPNDEAIALRIESITKQIASIKKPLLTLIEDAKRSDNKDATRRLGSMLNVLGKAHKAASIADKPVGSRISVAIKRLAQWRSANTVRAVGDVSLGELVELTADPVGYVAVCDFYRLTDAAKYSFGRQLEGPQFFVDIRRNVAILVLWKGDVRVRGTFAVSGIESPGVALPEAFDANIESKDCEDGLGELYDRKYDAEYKLIADLLQHVPDAKSSPLRAVLWSKKPLCASCEDVLLRQMPLKYPNIKLEVLIDADTTPVCPPLA